MSIFHNAIEKMKTSKKTFSDFFFNFIHKRFQNVYQTLLAPQNKTNCAKM